MAAPTVRSCFRNNLQRQFSIDRIWGKQSANHILQTYCISNTQHHVYHATPACLKKINSKYSNANLRQLFINKTLDDHVPVVTATKKSLLIEVWKPMTVKQLADSAKRDIEDVLEVLCLENTRTSYVADTFLTSFELISNVVRKLGGNPKLIASPDNRKAEVKYKDIVKSSPPDESVLVKRHPVVTIMGHVDHGKTTLLDALRNTSVVETEFGGITQHIGAFDVTLKSGDRVTFLDTPGHAAFASMRYRGAHITDIIVLVVAADDGVMEQTLQSIKMAKDANVPIIVAINKIDKPNADIKRTQNMLAENGILVEDLGGDTQCINISALKGTNLENLTEAIALQAELMDLKGDPVGLVEAVAIECSNHVGRGKLVTALIHRGTLRKGCLIVSGLAWAKVRAMFNESGRSILEARPSEAIQIIGWKDLPNVGDEILEVKNDKELQMVLKFRQNQQNETLAKEHNEAADKKNQEHLKQYKKILSLRREFGKIQPIFKTFKHIRRSTSKETVNTTPEVNVIIKGDVAGSVEAILDLFDTYTDNELCRLNIVHYNIGPVTETDLELAKTFNAIIYHFNVNIPSKLEKEAKEKGISVRKYNVIYKLFDDIKNEINSNLGEIHVEEKIGEASVLKMFEITDGKKKVNVAGCRCTAGVLQKSAIYHLVRNGEIIYTGKLTSMRHLKEEVSSIQIDVECGLRFEDITMEFQPNDTLVCFNQKKERQTINWEPGF
ncbi:translation initiation factor IF-2, mitochondrial isoform X1 [Colletes gigas]|uniref:translation initiation factor IF-2, mitochondrial isoform X1 n=1 Tax=Colletes gigas TaxID=935657 RepID=UPI001C9AC65B|nr:translation initiation factor IF-2, mitochondrial isoform X1 [Colletes gigas]